MGSESIIYQFSRSKVQRGDFSHFLSLYAPLRAMVMCCMPSTTTMQVDGQIPVKVTCDPLDRLNFLKHDFMPMNFMCEQAEMSERLIYDRSKAVFDHFGLPFDAEPPPSPARGHLCH